MKGQDSERIQRAIRQGHMHTDFLILLVNKMNWIILDGSQVRWLKIAFLHERIQNIGCSDDDEDVGEDGESPLRESSPATDCDGGCSKGIAQLRYSAFRRFITRERSLTTVR